MRPFPLLPLFAAGLLHAQDPGGPAAREEPVIMLAETAMQTGRPFHATELLDPVLAQGERRTPRLVLTAARAAAAWQGWTQVSDLLAGERWLDSLGGEGHALLARAALSRGDARGALTHAQRAVRTSDEADRGARLVLMARSLDRLDSLDAAAGSYLEAASRLGPVRDWLTLRAAAVTADSARRRELLATVTLPAALGRRFWASAVGAERTGRTEEASALYDALGARFRAIDMKLAGPRPNRPVLKQELLQALEGRLGADDTRAAIDLLDRRLAPLTPAEQLIVARRAAVSGTASRAAAGYAAAAGAGLLTNEDRFRYANVLAAVGRHQEAITQFGRVRGSHRGESAYLAARSRLRMGEATAAIAELGKVVKDYPDDPEGAGTALYLLGDLLSDRGEDSAAREAFVELGRRHPGHRFAPTARLRAALLAYQFGSPASAAAELDALRQGAGPEQAAAAYWAGRAWLRAGDTSAARVRWTAAALLNDEYYGLLSVRALGRPGWRPPTSVVTRPRLAWLDAALERIDLLEALGLSAEAGHELAWVRERAESSPTSMVEAARVFDSAGRHSLAVRYAIRAQGRGAESDRTLMRLLYPRPFPGLMDSVAAQQRLNPQLVASLIRQESAFDPRARSGADARGLMQVLPSLGREMAPRFGIGGWDVVLLYQPEVNLRMGARHLAGVLDEYPDLVHALAAYNAGGSRVRRWLQSPGAEDPEYFVERIPIPETRDYVRRILVNLARYQAIYPEA